jgi:hypothetical protein
VQSREVSKTGRILLGSRWFFTDKNRADSRTETLIRRYARVRLGEAIALAIYHVAICFAFKEPFQRGLGKQQVATCRNIKPKRQ